MAADPATGYSLFKLLMGLGGGLALFLYGMEQMASALKAVAGSRLRTVLAGLTSNRFMGVLTGALVTATVQSSSVTTVLVVGFITAGLMTLPQSIGVIMGANIGTTLTVQIIAFHITEYALLLVATGFSLTFLGRRNGLGQYGTMLMGLGMIFFGMSVMGDAMAPLRDDRTFLDFMVQLDAPWFGILVGTVFTALIQSSAATSGIVIMMAASGLISLPGAIAVTLGANVGTCATALLAAIGKPREAVRAAVVHLLFNLLGVLAWAVLVDELAGLVGLLGGGIEREIANAHLIFNLANTAVLIWFTEPIAKLVVRLVPDKLRPEAGVIRPRYLDPALLGTPSLALQAVRLELARLGARVRQMLIAILPETLAGTPEGLERVAGMDAPVDELHELTIDYLRRLGAGRLTDRESQELMDLMDVANAFENMGDIIETDLVTLGRRRIEERVEVAESTRAVITEVHAAVVQSLDLAIDAVARSDVASAHKVVAMKPLVNHLAEKAMRRGARRLLGSEPRKLQAYTREMEVIEKLKRVYYFAKRAAKVVAVEAESLETPPAAAEAGNG